jgi:hypothetical protein
MAVLLSHAYIIPWCGSCFCRCSAARSQLPHRKCWSCHMASGTAVSRWQSRFCLWEYSSFEPLKGHGGLRPCHLDHGWRGLLKWQELISESRCCVEGAAPCPETVSLLLNGIGDTLRAGPVLQVVAGSVLWELPCVESGWWEIRRWFKLA